LVYIFYFENLLKKIVDKLYNTLYNNSVLEIKKSEIKKSEIKKKYFMILFVMKYFLQKLKQVVKSIRSNRAIY